METVCGSKWNTTVTCCEKKALSILLVSVILVGNLVLAQERGASTGTSNGGRTKVVTLAWKGSMNSTDSFDEVIVLPVPYELPPLPYTSEDTPWSWDRQYYKKDVYGQAWPRQVQLYSSQD